MLAGGCRSGHADCRRLCEERPLHSAGVVVSLDILLAVLLVRQSFSLCTCSSAARQLVKSRYTNQSTMGHGHQSSKATACITVSALPMRQHRQDSVTLCTAEVSMQQGHSAKPVRSSKRRRAYANCTCPCSVPRQESQGRVGRLHGPWLASLLAPAGVVVLFLVLAARGAGAGALAVWRRPAGAR